MKKLILFLILLNFVSCGKDSETTGNSLGFEKSIFSSWISDETGQIIDMSAGEFETFQTLNVQVLTSQPWILTLISSSRDTVGMFDGGSTSCSYSFYMVNDGDGIGQFTLDTNSDADTIQNNTCLEYDSSCSGDTCAISSPHIYSITNNVLTIQYFSGSGGTETFR